MGNKKLINNITAEINEIRALLENINENTPRPEVYNRVHEASFRATKVFKYLDEIDPLWVSKKKYQDVYNLIYSGSYGIFGSYNKLKNKARNNQVLIDEKTVIDYLGKSFSDTLTSSSYVNRQVNSEKRPAKRVKDVIIKAGAILMVPVLAASIYFGVNSAKNKDRANSLENQIVTVEAQKEKMQTTIDRLFDTVANLSNKIEELKKNNVNSEVLKELESVKAELEQTKEKLATAEAEYRVLQGEYETLKTQYNKVMQERDNALSEVERLKKLVNSSPDADLIKKLNEAEARAAAAEKKATALVSQLAVTESKLTATEADLKKTENELSAVKKALNNSTKSLEEANKKINSLETTVKDLNAKISNLESQISEKDKKIIDLTNQLANAGSQEEINRLKSELAKVKNEKAKLNSELVDTRSKLADAETRANNAENRANDAENRNDELNQVIKELNGKITELEEKLNRGEFTSSDRNELISMVASIYPGVDMSALAGKSNGELLSIISNALNSIGNVQETPDGSSSNKNNETEKSDETTGGNSGTREHPDGSEVFGRG